MIVLVTYTCAQNQVGDWKDHQTGHELFITISNEMDQTFVILWFKDMLNNPRMVSINDKARKELDALCEKAHPGVIYTEVEMSNSNRNAYTYERLATKQLGVNLHELEYGPIAIVIKNGVGNQVVFKGNYQDFMETTDKLISEMNKENESDIEKSEAIKEAQELAKQMNLEKHNSNFTYFRPDEYSQKEYQTEMRYGFKNDPTYNENPVPLP